MTVRVQCSPYATITFPNAVADVFEPDTLTITREDREWILQPDEWTEAAVYDENGYPVYAFQNSTVRAVTDFQASATDARRI